MGFMDEYNELKKKRLGVSASENENKQQLTESEAASGSFMDEYNRLKAQRPQSNIAPLPWEKEEDDIAPVQGIDFIGRLKATSAISNATANALKQTASEKEEEKKEENKGFFDSILDFFGGIVDWLDVKSLRPEKPKEVQWVENTALAGLNTFNKGLTETADVILGKPLKELGWENNPISQANDYYQGTYEEFKEKADALAEEMGGGDILKYGGMLLEGTVAAVPNAILALMTAGTSAAGSAVGSATTTTSALATKAAYESGSILSKIGLTTQSMAQNPQYWLSFAQTYGSDYEEAKEKGASDVAAAFGATISSLVNAAIENGIDGGSGIQGLPQDILDGNKSKILEWVESSLEEGGEEVLQGVVSNLVSKVMYDGDTKVLDAGEMLENFGMGFAIGGILGGDQIATQGAVNAINSAIDSSVQKQEASKLTESEQKVVDKVIENRIAEESESGEVTNKRKGEIRQEVLRDLEKGYLSTDTIEEVLAGDSYKAYQDDVANEKALRDEYESLIELKKNDLTVKQDKRIAELEKLLADIDNGTTRAVLRSKLDEEVYGIVNGSRLANSYIEQGNIRKRFEDDVTKYENKYAQKTVQNMVERGVITNSNRSHELADTLTNLSSDRNIIFDVTNNKLLDESGHTKTIQTTKTFKADGTTTEFDLGTTRLDQNVKPVVKVGNTVVDNYKIDYKTGKIVFVSAPPKGKITVDYGAYATLDGFITKAEDGTKIITINVSSNKMWQTIVGHEVMHSLEGTKEADKVRKIVTQYAKDKGEYDSKLESIKKKYDEGTDYEGELVADFIGEYLFQDADFINHLSTNHRNLFQKIYDEIKYLLKVVTAGSKEARQLEKVKHAFENAYREGGKAQQTGTQYSITETFTDSNGTWFENAVLLDTDFFDGTPPRNWGAKLRDMLTKRASKDPFIMPIVDENGNATMLQFASPKDRVRKSGGSDHKVLNELSATSDNISKLAVIHVDEIVSVSEENSPYYTNENKHQWLDKNGWLHRNANVINRMNGNIYNLTIDIAKAADGRTILYATDGKIKKVGNVNVNSLKIKGSRQNSDFSDIIPQTEAEVNKKYSISDSDGNQLTDKQIEYFKDSKMRDDNGNLKVMYHGSQDAGFHTFDSQMSDDGTSFFFVDSNDVAASYSGTSETYEAKTIRTAEDMNNFLAEIGYDQYKAVEKDSKFELLENGDHVAWSDTAQGIYEEFCWYEGVGEGDANYKVYLNLKNPLEVDAQGRNWNNITREYSQEVADKYNSLTAEEKVALSNLAEWGEYGIFRDEMLEARASAEQGGSGVFDEEYTKNLASAYEKLGGANANLYDAFSIAQDNFSEESLKEFAVKQMKTRDYAKKAKAEGYDGVIFKNIVDVGGYSNGSEGASTVAIAFDSKQIKSVANQSPTGDPDIRYSVSDQETNEKLNNVGLQYDSKSETVSYSISSLEEAFDYNNGESEYLAAREEYVNELAKSIAVDKGNPSEEEIAKANRYLDSLFLVHDMIALDRDRLDYEAAVDRSSWVSNSEYGGSIDFSTLCAKRRLFTGTFDAIQNALPDTVLTDNDFLQIRNMLLEKGMESPCSMCYVEGSRAKHGIYVDKWLKEYLKTNPEWKPQLADFTSATRLERTRIEHPEAFKVYQDAMNKLSQRKPKEASVRTDYKGEILKEFADGSSVEAKNINGGIRFNSFSDFEIIHALDCMQVLMDMSRVGLNGQAYTKVKEFAEAFGNTGLKINLSLVAKGVDTNGKLVFDETNGMNYSEAMDIRNRYSDNVGTVLVVFNDRQLIAALGDITIDYVLPFHRSQWKKSQYTLMGLPNTTRDYTNIQNERYKNPATGRNKKVPTGNIMPNEYWDFNLSGRENAQKYLDYINENSYVPKFDFLLNRVNGDWVLPDGAVGDGYFKLLIDFKMYNNEGVGSPQKPVLPEFNMPYIQEMLDNYVGGHQAFPVAHDVVSEFVEGKKNGRFSLSFDGEAPIKRGNFATPMKDIRYEEAPTRETISEMETVEDFAPTQAGASATQRELLDSLSDEDAPPEMEAPYYGESAVQTTPKNPFDDRDIKEVGNRKVKSYMNENPEVKPFFQNEARVMLGDLERSLKGERWYNDDLYYDSNGENGWGGTKRHTTDDIAYLLDEFGYTYAEIENGLKAIIEDSGVENAIIKRIEFALNDRLHNGYTDIDGTDIPANQDYLNILAQKEAAEVAESQFAPYTDADAPIDDAPIKTAPIAEQYEAIRPQPSQAPRMVRADSNGKQRKWIGTSTESDAVDGKVLPEDLDQDLIHYQPISNKKTLGNANAKLNGMGYESSVAYFNGQFLNQKVTLDDIALGERLIQEAVKRGDTKTAGELIQNVAILGTELGQKVQALSIIKRLTPEGQLRMLQRTVERGKTKGDKAFEGVEITQDMIDHILKTYGKDGTYDQAKLNEAVEDVKQQIADQMKVGAIDYINEWRYLSMLGNPKTHIRNLVSNVAMKGTLAVKNTIAKAIEDIAPVKNRTKTLKRSSETVKNFAEQTTIEEYENNTDNKYSDGGSIKAKRQILKTKAGNWMANKNSELLTNEDLAFSKPAFKNAFGNFLTANGITTEADIKNNPKIVAKAKKYAMDQAKEATFQQDSYIASKISEIERRNPLYGIAIGSVMPFKKTPINIAKTGVAYSPLGIARNIYDAVQVHKGNMDASEAIDHLAQTITGTSLSLIGYALASMGMLNGAGDDDKEGKYDYQLGKQSYSFTFNGETYSLSWLSPVAMPLFVGANAYEILVEQEEWDMNMVVDALGQTLDPMSEMSFLSGLDGVLSSYDSGVARIWGAGESLVQNYITQFVPTLSSQIASTLDDTKRSTKASADSDFKFGEETLNKILYKIPGLRNTLEPTTDIWGNEAKQSDNLLERAFESFLSPSTRRENITTAVDEEIKDLYGQTGDTGLIPAIPQNYVSYDGVKYQMSADEHTAYKKTYGQTAYDLMEQLFATETYQNADSETRADMVNDVYDYARDEARKEYFAKKGVNFTNATEDGREYYKENAIKGAIENDVTPDEYRFSTENPEKYDFFKKNGITYEDYASSDEDGKRAYTWAYENPGKFVVSKAVASDVITYRKYTSDLYDIKADKDENGKSISGSRKDKVIDYINGMDADYGAKIILFKSEYPADDTYNYDIIDYLNERDDISGEEMRTILLELGFKVSSDGTITWD